ncbi:MAG: type III pantothenate kinase [Candidatus Omnitrophota bacterium]
MLLAIDIGNTNISFGIFKAMRIIKKFEIPTKYYSLKKLKKKLLNANIDDTLICSVVPKASKALKRDLEKLLGKQPLIIGKDIEVPIKNLYRKPEQVGQDRLVNAYAGVLLYKTPLIIIDFGTAVTFDVISKNKEYLGGMILPGLKASLEALAEKTALLPKIKLNKPKEFIGRDTQSSMLSGIIYGFSALTDELIKQIKKKIGRNTLAIGTGGNISLIGRHCKRLDGINADLTLTGLSLIYESQRLCR